MKVTITLTGTAPLLMHSDRLANPLDPIVREIKAITDKRKKTDADLAEKARLEFMGSLYFAEPIGPYLPGENIEKALVEGARITKQGKQVERGLFVTDHEVPLLYSGPRDLNGLWADESRRHMKSVRVGQSRVMRCRPMFTEWAVETVAELDDGLLSAESLQAIAHDGGAMVGIGDYRPRFGRYEAMVEVAS